MESTIYTIESDAGVYVSADPAQTNLPAAWIFHDPVIAEQQISQVENPSQLRVVPIIDLETWLDSLLAQDVTHVVEYLLPEHSTVRTTAGWLLMIRARQSGRELPKRG